MKRLVSATFAILISFALNAAVVDWQYKITSASKVANAYSGYTVYLVDKMAWDAAVIVGISASTFSDANIVKDSANFSAGSGAVKYTYSTLSTDSTASIRSATLSDAYVAENASKDFYYIVLNATTNPNQWQNVASVSLKGRSSSGEAELGGVMSATQAVFDGGTWTPVGAGPTPVPEPTTGLLVLAGLAGLALRRRRA